MTVFLCQRRLHMTQLEENYCCLVLNLPDPAAKRSELFFRLELVSPPRSNAALSLSSSPHPAGEHLVPRPWTLVGAEVPQLWNHHIAAHDAELNVTCMLRFRPSPTSGLSPSFTGFHRLVESGSGGGELKRATLSEPPERTVVWKQPHRKVLPSPSVSENLRLASVIDECFIAPC